MITLIQRVLKASVRIDSEIVGQIDQGLLLLLCAEKNDTQEDADKLLKRVINYRIFSDENGKMNHSVKQIQGNLLIVPQFTLAADTHSGTRPSFSPAADPQLGNSLFEYFVEQARKDFANLQTGRFGADMQVELINNGPVTFWLDTHKKTTSSVDR